MNTKTKQSEDPRTKHETLLLILHYLEEEDMTQSAQTLRDEISARRRGATVRLRKSKAFTHPHTHTHTHNIACTTLQSTSKINFTWWMERCTCFGKTNHKKTKRKIVSISFTKTRVLGTFRSSGISKGVRISHKTFETARTDQSKIGSQRVWWSLLFSHMYFRTIGTEI